MATPIKWKPFRIRVCPKMGPKECRKTNGKQVLRWETLFCWWLGTTLQTQLVLPGTFQTLWFKTRANPWNPPFSCLKKKQRKKTNHLPFTQLKTWDCDLETWVLIMSEWGYKNVLGFNHLEHGRSDLLKPRVKTQIGSCKMMKGAGL